MENGKLELKIDETIDAILPKQTEEEYKLLEQSMLAEGGARDEILATPDGRIVDGATRWRIATKHGLKYRVKVREFAGEGEIIEFVWNNQRGRRNLSQREESYLRHKLRESTPPDSGADSASATNGGSAAAVAGKAKVSERTIRRDSATGKALDNLTAPLRKAYLAGDFSASAKTLESLADKTPEEQQQIAKQIKKGVPLKKAVGQQRPSPTDLLDRVSSTLQTLARQLDEAREAVGTRCPEDVWNMLEQLREDLAAARLRIVAWEKSQG